MLTLRESQRDRAVLDMMAGLSRRTRRQVVGQMTCCDVGPGTVLTVEGAPGREFYVITGGTVEVRIDDDAVAEVDAGDFFGEIALLGGCRRTATVVAADDVTVEVLNRREFATVLDLWPSFAQTVTRRATRRLYELDQG